MAGEEHDWMLCMLFAALGVALGTFLSSVYPAFFALSAPSGKDASASCRKASSTFWQSRILELRFLCNTKKMEGHKHTLFDTRENQLGASQHPIHSTEKLNQKKRALDFCDNKSMNASEHQRSMSQLLNDSTKPDQRRNDHDACMQQSAASWYPFSETSFSDNHGGNYVQSSELVMPSSTPSGEFRLPHGDLKPDPFDPSKRDGYLSWDDYFMAIAFLSALRSKDPNRQVGACLVSQDRVILGIGYNGFPRGCSDDELPWAKMSVNNDPLQTKYPYVCHAEVNAILNKNHASASGQRLYVTMFPCNECAKIIIQAGVAEVVYIVGKNSSTDCSYVASRKMLSMAGVKVWQHQPAQQKVILDFKR